MAQVERAHILDPAGDQGWRHEPGIVQHHHLFGRITHAFRIVDHQRGALQPLKNVGGGDVAKVKRRVLPHQHHVDVGGKVDLAIFAFGVVIARDPLRSHRRGPCGDPAFIIGQRLHIIVKQQSPARLRRKHQGERAVASNIDRLDGVHLDGDAEAHLTIPVQLQLEIHQTRLS